MREKADDVGDDEMSLDISFPQFCATCEKQIVTPNSNHLFCSEACRLCDSRPEANGTTDVQLDWKDSLVSSQNPGNGHTPLLSPRGLQIAL